MITPADIATTASALTVVIAVVFGILTLRQWHRTRYLTAAAELVRTMQTPEFTGAIRIVMALPNNATRATIETNAETVGAVHAVIHVFESLGVMVFHRLLPLHLVDDLLGGYSRASWRRLDPYVKERRAELGVQLGEWFQWLADRLDEDPAPGKSLGAYAAHRTWRS